LKIFQRSRNLDDFITLKQLRAKTRYLVKSSKTNSWKTFTSNIDSQTDPKLVWNKIRILRGQNNEKQIHIIIDNQLNTDPTTVVYTIWEHFQKNSSDNNYAKGFIEKYRNQRNQQLISIVNPCHEEQIYLNTTISLEELITTITKCKSHSPGPDDIPYIFLQNLPTFAYHILLDIYNTIFSSSGYLPSAWKHATTIPIPKPGKNKFEINGYRPISLLNTMCKVLEKIIDTRLHWFLEKSNYFSPHQHGFRQYRSTFNCLHDIQAEVYESFKKGHILSLVSLDHWRN
jgi:hypothetical protein